jgi:hypothetical protein
VQAAVSRFDATPEMETILVEVPSVTTASIVLERLCRSDRAESIRRGRRV